MSRTPQEMGRLIARSDMKPPEKKLWLELLASLPEDEREAGCYVLEKQASERRAFLHQLQSAERQEKDRNTIEKIKAALKSDDPAAE